MLRDSIPRSTITRVPYKSQSKIPSQWLSVQGQPPRYKASATSQQIYLKNVALWDWLQDFSIREQCPTFLAPRTSFVEDSLSMDRATGVGGDGFRMIQVYNIYCAFYFYYYTRPISDYALDPERWGPLQARYAYDAYHTLF